MRCAPLACCTDGRPETLTLSVGRHVSTLDVINVMRYYDCVLSGQRHREAVAGHSRTEIRCLWALGDAEVETAGDRRKPERSEGSSR